MEETPFKASDKSSGRHDSVKSSSKSDIRNLWSTATLSQPKLNSRLTSVYEDSELESSSIDSKTGQWYNQKTSHDSDGVWEECNDGIDKVCTKQEEPDRHDGPRSSLRRHLEGDEDFPGTKMEISSSMSSLSILKRTPHQAYWVEQQNRLPLPLMELMENEALEILTKALRSYRSGLGKDHILTKQLQRYIERLKGRRNKRQHRSLD
ncbi:cation channel sperm-associated protein subunit zeta [Molossus molossus]|uniref:Catsper channel auxiliary subunit zeta n=1 Tax=Molossus molossus TaxID=27622 RepID=A0A7J8ENW0_MOLMO|nr:cation channel sperm-associated protein subunit zeta [Molossus molossus]KAF6437130.1 catsper channel auxiliary subunit zeta [Molossus molossus]